MGLFPSVSKKWEHLHDYVIKSHDNIESHGLDEPLIVGDKRSKSDESLRFNQPIDDREVKTKVKPNRSAIPQKLHNEIIEKYKSGVRQLNLGKNMVVVEIQYSYYCAKTISTCVGAELYQILTMKNMQIYTIMGILLPK